MGESLPKGLSFTHKYPFLAIHAKGGESISLKQKDRTTTNLKNVVFQFVLKKFFKWVSYFDIISNLKQGEKISNLENASQNLIHLPLTICKRP
jgi:hypothetical protein